MKVMHIWPEQLQAVGARLEFGGTVEIPGSAGRRLRYSMPRDDAADASRVHDFLLVATLFAGMQGADTIRVHGAVSRSRLENLEEFVRVWHCWRPEVYRVPDLDADTVYDLPGGNRNRAICAFSGGLDSCCALRRHARAEAGRRSRNVGVAALIHGFDIRPHDEHAFRIAHASASAIARSAGRELRTITTNSREFNRHWEDSFFAQTAAALMIYGGGCDSCIIGSDEPYSDLAVIWGSNPVTNHLLSSNEFSVFTDSLELRRLEKLEKIVGWPEARRHMRVCWQPGSGGRNCGACEKCIRTRLEFLCHGIETPECFGSEPLPRELIHSIHASNPVQLSYLKEILNFAEARAKFRGADWIEALRGVVQRGVNGSRPGLLKRVRNGIRGGLGLGINGRESQSKMGA